MQSYPLTDDQQRHDRLCGISASERRRREAYPRLLAELKHLRASDRLDAPTRFEAVLRAAAGSHGEAFARMLAHASRCA